MSTLAQGGSASDADQVNALDSLRDVALSEDVRDQSDEVLAALAADVRPEAELDDGVEDALASLAAHAPETSTNQEAAATEAALAALAAAAPEESTVAELGKGALASLRDLEPVADVVPEDTSDVLSDLARVGEELKPAETPSSDGILEGLAAAEIPETEAPDQLAEILSGVEATEPEPQQQEDDLADVLGSLQGLPTPDEDAAEGETSDAILEGLAAQEATPEPEAEELSSVLDDLSAAAPDEVEREDSDLTDILGTLDESDADEQSAPEVGDILAEVLATGPDVSEETAQADDLADILSGLEQGGEAEAPEADVDLQDLLGDISASDLEVSGETVALDDVLAGLEPTDDPTDSEALSDLEDVLSDLATQSPTTREAESAEDLSLEALLSDLDLDEDSPADGADVDSILSDLELTEETDGSEDPEASLSELLGTTDTEEADLDELLGSSDPGDDTVEDELNLDDLLGDLTDEPSGDTPAGADGLDDLLADLADETEPDQAADDLLDLDALLGDLESEASPADGTKTIEPEPGERKAEQRATIAEPEFAYGTISAERPEAQQLTRKRFRIALFGDFSGRAARGQVETGEALAKRPGILLDPDTVEEVIEGFACELILPLGQDEGGIAVKLKEFDDLHPDELFENVALFAELVSLRSQLQSGVTVDHASRSLASWAEQYGTPVRVPKRSSPSNSVPADRRLSAFQQLIGDSDNTLREASPIEELLARVVGPHIRALPSPELPAMQAAVDAALSDAMRLVLHHPEFQSLEAQWRSLDLIARSVEVDDSLEVVLYDVSAEELAADLAAQDDLTESGFTRLLTEEPMDPDLGRGGYSALIGMYGFEETPPHAELLGRIARVAAHVDAPFFTSLSPEFLKTAKKDRPALVGNAWDTLQQMPEAGHLALASPRFLLRRPYGAKSNPVDAFDFEEFSEAEGLKGMLWGNPVVLVTILLARSFKQNGASMQLGSIMSLGGMPFHTVNDHFGDQVALPCTERNIDLDKIVMANERGVMAISAVKGRDELRLTSFSSLAGGEVLGPWSGVPAPAPSPADPRDKTGIAPAKPAEPAVDAETEADDLDLSDLGLDDLGLDDLDLSGEESGDATAEAGDLDALLAGFGDETDADEDNDEMDAELAALLADL
ncbi:type VI secretion system contractile sheath domain-containing protein [Pseudophaeobacter sp. EL27]|uniref:type VI secretion system contractile sheath domain-containing protein n=1 Tax=Pseudophaeobacter sp. EL27 TaxID=2107580 RepID=UPI0020B16792|nr:type VI secretion system contractile sheath large subunit [Pseudophaeobacter sp. EL27]